MTIPHDFQALDSAAARALAETQRTVVAADLRTYRAARARDWSDAQIADALYCGPDYLERIRQQVELRHL